MLKIRQMKAKQDEAKAAGVPQGPKQSPGELRVQKDVGELNFDHTDTVSITFPNPDDLMNFKVAIMPDEGFYAGGRFQFSITIPSVYPHEPPKCHCDTKVYHPNIDLQGNVCLNILREEWKPILSISAVVYGLQFLFLEPNPEDPLNKAAAETMQQNLPQFKRNVMMSMRGGYTIDGVDYS